MVSNGWKNASKTLARCFSGLVCLILLLFPMAIAQAQSIVDDAHANVIYYGEQHDNSSHHLQELQFLQQLHQQKSNLVLGLEMFQRPFQSTLDQYSAGHITADELREESEFDQRWGYDWNDYAPILAFAQENHIPIRALNTPVEIIGKVGQGGFKSLQAEDWRWIPEEQDLDLTKDAYRDNIRKTYDEFHKGQGNSTSFEHFYQAQILWDETMADAIASYVNQHPDSIFVTLVGAGHVISDDGIPSRVKRRITLAQFDQATHILETTKS